MPQKPKKKTDVKHHVNIHHDNEIKNLQQPQRKCEDEMMNFIHKNKPHKKPN